MKVGEEFLKNNDGDVIRNVICLYPLTRALRFSGENLVPINVTLVDGGRRRMVEGVVPRGVVATAAACRVGEIAWERGVRESGTKKKNGKDLCSWSTLSCSLRRLIREKACAGSGSCIWPPRGPNATRCRITAVSCVEVRRGWFWFFRKGVSWRDNNIIIKTLSYYMVYNITTTRFWFFLLSLLFSVTVEHRKVILYYYHNTSVIDKNIILLWLIIFTHWLEVFIVFVSYYTHRVTCTTTKSSSEITGRNYCIMGPYTLEQIVK